MDAVRRDRLIGQFYDAAFSPALWPGALQSLADAFGGYGVALLSRERPKGVWVRVDPAAQKIFETRFTNSNPFASYVHEARSEPGYAPRVYVDEQVVSRHDYHRTDFFNDFMRPFGGGAMAMLDLGRRNISAAVNVTRTRAAAAFEDGEIRELASLHDDLSRAFWLSVRLDMSGALDASLIEMLDRSQNGYLLLDGAGQIVHTNPAADALLRRHDGLLARRQHLTAIHADDQQRLLEAVAAATGAAGVRTASWLKVRRTPPARPLSLSVSPLSGDRPELFEARTQAVVSIVDPGANWQMSPEQLGELLELTPAQARLALKLAEGLDLRTAAEVLGIAFNTARAHLYEILARTNTRRQSELMLLVSQARQAGQV